MATDKNKYLENVLESHRIRKEQDLLNKHLAKRDAIKEEMEKHFASLMYAPFNSGSLAKNTAVNTKFDIDLMAPFKKNAFGSSGTLKDMYEGVYKFLYDKYHGKEATVRRQKVSIGIEFYPDADGHIVKVDVVPGRELNQDEFKDDKRLNLYVYEQFGKIESGAEHLRSNINAQIDHIKDRATKEKDSIRKIIRLLKVWKINKGFGPKSFFLELVTIKAFDSLDISGDLWDKLKTVMEYIRDKVKDVSLPDPGNSGNEVADTLTDSEKADLSNDMKYMLERIEENSDNIKLYFKVNPKHPVKEDAEESTYKIKKDGVSVPPPVRFG